MKIAQTMPFGSLCYFYCGTNTTANKYNYIEVVFVTLTKSSRERGLASSGCGFGRRFRSPLHSAGKPGAQPSGTDSFRRTAGSGQGGATVRSHNVPAECLGILNILELTQPGLANPLSRRPSLQKITHTQNVTNSPHIILKRHTKSIKKTKIPIEIRPKLCYNITSKRKNLQ